MLIKHYILFQQRRVAKVALWILRDVLFLVLVIDRVAGEIVRLVASVCVRVCVRLSVGALLFEPFDL